MKTCTKCKGEKELTEFQKCRRNKNSLKAVCRGCVKIRAAEWYSKNKVKATTTSKAYREANKEKTKVRHAKYRAENKDKEAARHKKYSVENKEKVNAIGRKWSHNNPAKMNAKNAKRRATKLQATPEWADLDHIKRTYEWAKVMEERTGRKIHVDHIVPLQGENVCGLHCEANLQLMFAEDNMSKGNKHG